MGISKWIEGAERVGANFENIRLEHAKTNSPVVWWCEERHRFNNGRIQEIEGRFLSRKIKGKTV